MAKFSKSETNERWQPKRHSKWHKVPVNNKEMREIPVVGNYPFDQKTAAQPGFGEEKTEMADYATVEAISTLGTVRNASQGARRKSILSLTWALDPTTGKPVARWVAEGSATTANLMLRSAA
jgi:hypothetical protein